MTFDDFVAPLGNSRFAADVLGRVPVHIVASERRRLEFGWAQMNDLFALAPHWTPGNIKLILNSRPIEPRFYMDEVQTFDGTVLRADPAKVDLFLGMGASLVANGVETVAPSIAAVTEMLAARFTAPASANIYCSFDGVQAFATHYDTHEVFALQCEGEKVWRLYAHRAIDPTDPPEPGPDAQARIDAARGPLAMEVRMRPGDLLYIPRGCYHDALAQHGASLHITFAIAPRTGRLLARIIGEAIERDPAFGAYLPGPDDDDGKSLAAALDGLAARVGAMIRSPAFSIEIAAAQRKAALPRHRLSLPARPTSPYYARTDRPVELRGSPAGTSLTANGRSHELAAAGEAAIWALSRPAFSTRELDVRFPHVPAREREALVDLLIRERLVQSYTPAM